MGKSSSKGAITPLESDRKLEPGRASFAVNKANAVTIKPGFALVPLVETSEAVIYSTQVKADTTAER
jgi:hypothetical protein